MSADDTSTSAAGRIAARLNRPLQTLSGLQSLNETQLAELETVILAHLDQNQVRTEQAFADALPGGRWLLTTLQRAATRA